MKPIKLVHVFIVSVLSTIFLSGLSFFCLRILNDNATRTHRQEQAQDFALEVENKESAKAVEDFNKNHTGPHGLRFAMWIVDESGRVLASNSPQTLPVSWQSIEKPQGLHDYTNTYQFYSLVPDLTIIRLTGQPASYLVSKPMIRSYSSDFLIAQLALSSIFIFLAMLLSLSLAFFYLQRKRKQANARRELLQELSHDFRTPLTSLSTSVETLQDHFPKLTEQHRDELFAMIRGDLTYLVHLLEDLFFIADLDEPKHKMDRQKLDLIEILSGEIKFRQSMPHQNIVWQFEYLSNESSAFFSGDRQLSLRLFKNLLDNAGRFASSIVKTRILSSRDEWIIEIEDDGRGMNEVEMRSYGQRQMQRSFESSDRLKISLGLGSVIIKRIVEIFQGRLEIKNLNQASSPVTGILVRLYFKKIA